LVTAVVRWSMPQLCPKITSLPAQSPYILFKRSRAASCGSGSSEPSSGSCLSPTANSRPSSPPCRRGSLAARPFWRWPVSGPRLPRWPTAWPPAAVRQHISPGGALCAFPPHNPHLHIALSVPTEQTIQASARPEHRCRRGRFSTNQVPPESEPGLDPGSTTPQRREHDGVHSLADALSPVLTQAVRDTPRR
jgi:hypothetical protein